MDSSANPVRSKRAIPAPIPVPLTGRDSDKHRTGFGQGSRNRCSRRQRERFPPGFPVLAWKVPSTATDPGCPSITTYNYKRRFEDTASNEVAPLLAYLGETQRRHVDVAAAVVHHAKEGGGRALVDAQA